MPTLGDEHGDPALGGGQPFLARTSTDLPELAARLLDPGRGPELLEAGERSLDRLAGAALLPRAPPDDAEREQRASPSERVADLLVLVDRAARGGDAARSPSPCAAATRPRQRVDLREHPLSAEPRCVRLPDGR